MKKFLIIVLACIIILSLCFCGKQNSPLKKVEELQEISRFAISGELPNVKLDIVDYNEFLTFINYDQIDCPYSELFGIEAALNEKASRNFEVFEHTYDFLKGASFVDAQKLYDVVKSNNQKLMDGPKKYFNDEPSNAKLKNCCEIVATSLNWCIENVEGIDLAELSCLLGNLTILENNSMNLGTYSDKTGVLNISPKMIESKNALKGVSNSYEFTVSHEAMHILQCRCCDVEQNEDDHFIGTSFAFESLEINPLQNHWLYEASAELNTALQYGINPTTYQYMIDNLESISLATVLNDNVKPRQLEKLCFTKNENALYSQLEFTDTKKAIEFLYAIELLREKPDDFKKIYEQQYGELKDDYDEFIKITYNPYFVEVVSKLTYKNLAQKLSQNEMCLNDVFYIISLYELDLMKDIPFDNTVVKNKYIGTYENYIELQNKFFSLIQKNTGINIVDSFKEYKANFGDTEIYANAKLEWLDGAKKDYLLSRNSVLYDKHHKPIAISQ